MLYELSTLLSVIRLPKTQKANMTSYLRTTGIVYSQDCATRLGIRDVCRRITVVIRRERGFRTAFSPQPG